MRLDPKYFNLFIAICALLTLIVIIYGTIRYSDNQAADFRESIAEVQLDTLSFISYSANRDTIAYSDFTGAPTIIQFWSTWSGKSHKVNTFLESYQLDHPELIVIAAAVRDGEDQIRNHIDSTTANFIFVEGTPFFHELLVPGVPSQIIIDRQGRLFDTQVGDNTTSLQTKLDRLIHE